MKFFDFLAFQNFKRMLSHDKIIFHMLFGAFHITPRIFIWKFQIELVFTWKEIKNFKEFRNVADEME